MVNDKRNIHRQRKRLQLRFGVAEANRIGFTDDISPTGLFIKSAIVQNPQTLLKIELTAPDGELIVLTGRVMWAKKVPPNLLGRIKGGMGIRIIDFQRGEDSYRSIFMATAVPLA
jgi:PilZ domain